MMRRESSKVCHTRCGLTLKKISAVLLPIDENKWLEQVCDNFNLKSKKTEYPKSPNMYVLNESFVSPTTSHNRELREEIPNVVLEAAGVPEAPLEDLSYSEMVNPEGVQIDYFVLHWWGHSYRKIVASLTKFAKEINVKIEKKSPDEIVFWVCTFALN